MSLSCPGFEMKFGCVTGHKPSLLSLSIFRQFPLLLLGGLWTRSHPWVWICPFSLPVQKAFLLFVFAVCSRTRMFEHEFIFIWLELWFGPCLWEYSLSSVLEISQPSLCFTFCLCPVSSWVPSITPARYVLYLPFHPQVSDPLSCAPPLCLSAWHYGQFCPSASQHILSAATSNLLSKLSIKSF